MKAQRHNFTVEKMCKVFNIGRSGFYDWLKRKPSKYAQEREIICNEVKSIYTESQCRYGSPKITKELKIRGFHVSRPRVAKIMKENNLKSIIVGKFKVCTTDSNHDFRISPNLLDRKFTTDGISKAWVSDITYIKTKQGWLYLTVIMDLFDRKIIGWSMSSSLTANQTVIPAWKMAITNRPLLDGIIFHSDRGVQYACKEFRSEIESKVEQSMSRKGNCWDNAVIENFFKILKSETNYKKYESRDEAKKEIFEFIEIWYNRKRIHSALGYLTPLQFGQIHSKNAA
jgi:transposase InsO family protein